VDDWQTEVFLTRPEISQVETPTDQSTWTRRDGFSTGLSAPVKQMITNDMVRVCTVDTLVAQ